jgi:phosphate transport system protein
MTRMILDQQLRELDARVLFLGSLIEHSLTQDLEVLQTAAQEQAHRVVEAERAIDELHLAIEQYASRILRMQQPLGGHDLRYVISVMPISIDLERIGDEVEQIALMVLRMQPLGYQGLQGQWEASAADTALTAPRNEGQEVTEASLVRALLVLGREVDTLLQGTMKAFAERDAQAARQLWTKDREIDRRGYAVRQDAMTFLESPPPAAALQQDPGLPERLVYLQWVAHFLERAADHCTNICERIVYIVQGETDMEPLLQE